MKKMLLALCGFAFALNVSAQDNPWQQQADYQMDVTMDDYEIGRASCRERV